MESDSKKNSTLNATLGNKIFSATENEDKPTEVEVSTKDTNIKTDNKNPNESSD